MSRRYRRKARIKPLEVGWNGEISPARLKYWHDRAQGLRTMLYQRTRWIRNVHLRNEKYYRRIHQTKEWWLLPSHEQAEFCIFYGIKRPTIHSISFGDIHD